MKITPGFNRKGPRGVGPMTGGGNGLCNPRGFGVGYGGFGFLGSSPPWPYIGRGHGGYAHCRYRGFHGVPAYPNYGQEQDIESRGGTK